MSEQLFNDPGTSLAANVLGTDTSITVSSTVGFPSTGNFRIRVEDELMLVTSVVGATWGVTRGIESTNIVPHASGAAVNAYLTAGGMTQWVGDTFFLTGTFANLPAAGTPGRIYLFTDSLYDYGYDNGTSWQFYCDGKQMIPPSATAGWTNFNFATGITVDDTYGYRSLYLPATYTSGTYAYQYISVPSFPYTRTIYVKMAGPYASYAYGCIVLSDGSKLVSFNGYTTNGSGLTLSIASYTVADGSAGGSNPLGGDCAVGFYGSMLGLRIVDDGTNLSFWYSCDGAHWLQYRGNWGRTAFFPAGPTRIGFGSLGYNSGSLPRVVDFLHFG